MSVVKLAETLMVISHICACVLVAKLIKELVWSFPKLLHKQTSLILKRYVR